METFIKYIKQPHIQENFKSTFDVSAKFQYPEPSEAQKTKYFEQEITSIFQKFYTYLTANNILPKSTEKEMEQLIKDGLDQSNMVMEFYDWLELDTSKFKFVEKPKGILIINQPPYTNPGISQANKFANRAPENKPNTNIPFYIQKVPPQSQISPPKPIHNPAPQQNVQFRPAANTHQYGQNQQYYNAKQAQDKDKPVRIRLVEKLAELMDCPERLPVIKFELNALTKRQR